MAKKKPNVVDGDLSFDDFDDFDFDIPDDSVKDDRKPVTKVLAGVGEGVVNRAKDPQFMKETMKRVFPRSIGQAIDLGDEVTDAAKNLYDESVAEIKPTLKMARKTISKLVPADASMAPKWVNKMLENWRKEPEDGADSHVSKDQARDTVLNQTLKDIFEAQQATETARVADQVGRDNLKIGLETTQGRRQLDALNRAAISLKRLDDYNSTIGLNFQKKSLEMQYRQLFATQDTLEFVKSDVIKRNEFLASIAKNTALPEFVKLNNKEAGQEIRRRQKAEMMHNAIWGVGDRFITQGIEKIKKSVLDSTKNLMGDLRGGLDMMGMMGDMSNSGMMGDPAKMAGQAGGSMALDGAAGFFGKMLVNKMKGGKLDQKFGISDKLNNLEGKMESLPQLLNTFKNSRKWDYDMSAKGTFLNFLQGLMPSMKADEAVSPTTSKNLFEPTSFSVQTARSINEVIPGFLARIFRELRIMRTGDASIGLTDFSHDKGSFVDAKDIEKDVDTKVVPGGAVKRTRSSLDEITGMIDPDGKGMSKKERQFLQKHLLKNSIDLKEGNEEAFTDVESFRRRDKNVDEKMAAKVAAKMEKFFSKLSSEDRVKFVKQHNTLNSDMFDPRQVVQDMLDAGQIDYLRERKLIKEEGNGPIKATKINVEEILRRYIEDEVDPGNNYDPRRPTGPANPNDPDGKGKLAAYKLLTGGKRQAKKVAVKTRRVVKKVKQAAGQAADKIEEITPQRVKDKVGSIRDQAVNTYDSVAPQVAEAARTVQDKAMQAAANAPENLSALRDHVVNAVRDPKAFAQQMGDYGSRMKTSFTSMQLPKPMFEVIGATPEQQAALQQMLQNGAEGVQSLKTKAASLKTAEGRQEAKEALQKAGKQAREKASKIKDRVVEQAAPKIDQAKAGLQTVLEEVKDQGRKVKDKLPKSRAEMRDVYARTSVEVKRRGKQVVDDAKSGKLLEDAKAQGAKAKDKASKLASQVIEDAKSGKLANDAKEGIAKVRAKAEPKVRKVKDLAQEAKAKMQETIQEHYDPDRVVMGVRLGDAQQRIEDTIAEQKQRMGEHIAQAKETLTTQVAEGKKRLKTLAEKTKAAKEASVTAAHNTLVEEKPEEQGERVTRMDQAQAKKAALKKAQKAKHQAEMAAKAAKRSVQGKNVLKPVAAEKPQFTPMGMNLFTGNLAGQTAAGGEGAFAQKQGQHGAANALAQVMKADKLKKQAENGMLAKRDDIHDVYVEGEDLPRMTAHGIRAGEYFLKETKEVITNTAQIKGAIIDKSGKVVIMPQELARVIYFDSQHDAWKHNQALPLTPMGAVREIAAGLKKGLETKGKSLIDLAKKELEKDYPADLYVEGETDPRLYAIKMRKGEYVNAQDNSPIRTPKDIKGEVRDIHGTLVILAEDVPKLRIMKMGKLTPIKFAWKITKALAVGAWRWEKLMWKWTKWNFKMLGKMTGAVTRSVGKALGFNIQDPPRDVYVAGEDKPRLEASGFKKGMYFDRDTHKAITHESKITGPVVDANGNTLLDAEDIKNMVVFKKELGKFSPLNIAKQLLLSPFKAVGWAARKLWQGKGAIGKVLGPMHARYAGALLKGAGEVASGVGGAVMGALGVRKRAVAIGPDVEHNKAQAADVEAKAQATQRYKTLDKLKSGLGGVVGKFKSLFGLKPNLNQLASLPIGDAAAVKSSATLGEIAAMVKAISQPKKKARPGEGFADDDARHKAEKERTDKLREDMFNKLNKKKGEGKDGKKDEEGGFLSGLLDKFGLGDLLGKGRLGSILNGGKNLLGKMGGLKGLAGKAAMPLAAAAAAYGGVSSESEGKHVENFKDIVPDGFWNKLNPFAYAMNAGRFGGNLMNKHYGFMSKLVGGSGSLGSDAYGLLHKDPMKQMEEEEKKRKEAKKDKPGADKDGKTEADKRKEEQDKEDKEKKRQESLAQKITKAIPIGGAQAAPVPAQSAAPAGSPTTAQPYAGAEGEQPPPPGSGADAKADSGASAPSSVPKADGPPADGSNGLNFAALQSGVKLDGLNPSLQKNLFGMVEEYGTKTGKKVPFNDGFRSRSDQEAMFKKSPPGKAARPGTSMHEFGLAVDINSKAANEMEQMGLMRKYGFTRPVGKETWHVEPIGIQSNLAQYKKDPNAAAQAIEAGVGKGGGGIGTNPSARLGSRDPANSAAIIQAGDDKPKLPADAPTPGKDVLGKAKSGEAQSEDGSAVQTGSGGTVKSGEPASPTSATKPVKKQATAILRNQGGEGESKPTGGDTPRKVATASLKPSTSSVQGENKMANGPADPSAKVPAPQGVGKDAVMPTIEAACKLVGYDKDITSTVVACESGFDPNAKAKTSSATGLGQFTSETWRGMMNRYASKYGLDPSTPPTDARANAILTAQYLKDNAQKLSSVKGAPAEAVDVYMGHFLGTGGASTFLKSLKTNPDGNAADAMPKAAAANKPIFYNNGMPRSTQQVYSLMQAKLRDKAKAFGLNAPTAAPLPAASGGSASSLGESGAETGIQSKGLASASPSSKSTNFGAPVDPTSTPRDSGAVRPSFRSQSKGTGALAIMPTASAPGMPARGESMGRAPTQQPSSSMIGGMDSGVFAKAEDLLGQQLSVQKEMRDALVSLLKEGLPGLQQSLQKSLENKGAEAQATQAAQAPQSTASGGSTQGNYQVPRVAVSMKRAIA